MSNPFLSCIRKWLSEGNEWTNLYWVHNMIIKRKNFNKQTKKLYKQTDFIFISVEAKLKTCQLSVKPQKQHES